MNKKSIVCKNKDPIKINHLVEQKNIAKTKFKSELEKERIDSWKNFVKKSLDPNP